MPAEVASGPAVDDPGPVDCGLVTLALERVQVFGQRAFAVATGRGCHEAFKFRQDQIENLRGMNVESALLKEKSKGIRRLITRNLQDAFIHDKHHHAGRPLGRATESEHVAWFDLIRRGDRGQESLLVQFY